MRFETLTVAKPTFADRETIHLTAKECNPPVAECMQVRDDLLQTVAADHRAT